MTRRTHLLAALAVTFCLAGAVSALAASRSATVSLQPKPVVKSSAASARITTDGTRVSVAFSGSFLAPDINANRKIVARYSMDVSCGQAFVGRVTTGAGSLSRQLVRGQEGEADAVYRWRLAPRTMTRRIAGCSRGVSVFLQVQNMYGGSASALLTRNVTIR